MTLYTLKGIKVRPADWAVTRVNGFAGRFIRVGQWLNGSGFRDWEHACFYAGGDDDLILEAEPGGAKLRPYHYPADQVLWSCDNPELADVLTDEQRAMAMDVARHYEGIPYSFLDYDAIAAHRLHIPAPGLKHYIADTGHQICSQLTDQCCLDLGWHLFTDGRWPGYVDPEDLANLASPR